ncbi:hypothetical protein VUJ46_17430 [Chryseobacterium sp. MYb264]|nr:hypothetical protein VUJ46_17430 [Chryseobacterium sp. MYb264]
MKLVELTNYFRNGGSYDEFCEFNELDQEAEVIEIYMKQPLNINGD